jgi:hypothetical protein
MAGGQQHGQQHGLFHVDGTTGAARTVENSIYRNPIPWVVSDDLIVRKGDWIQGLILDEKAWGLYKAGKIGGLSPQGIARRRKVAKTVVEDAVAGLSEQDIDALAGRVGKALTRALAQSPRRAV